MIKKIMGVSIAVLLLFSTVGLTACKEDGMQQIDFIIGYTSNASWENDELKCIVNTFEMWDTLKTDGTRFAEVDKYDDEQFFITKSLIIFWFHIDKGKNIEIESIKKNDTNLLVQIVYDFAGSMDIAYAPNIAIIEVTKSDITNANNVTINTNTREN